MKRLGSLIVFKVGVTEAQIRAAVKTLEDNGMVEPHLEYPTGPDGKADYGKKPKLSGKVNIESFDDAMGSPTWYIP